MKRPSIAAALLFALATPALAEPPSPAITATPLPAACAPSFAEIQPAAVTNMPKHAKRATPTSIATPATLFPLSFGQQQEAAREELETTFHIDHSS